MIKRTLSCLFVLTLAFTTALFGAEQPAIAHTTHIVAGKSAQQRVPATLHKIFSNLGPLTNEYQAGIGYYVAGPTNTTLGHSQFMAVPFTMGAKGYLLAQVRAPLQWFKKGHNIGQLCLYTDNSGVVGKQIGKCVTKKNLPAFGTTNTLSTFEFLAQNLALRPHKTYWIVGQTPSTGANADATDVWCGESVFMGFNVDNGGWGSFNPDTEGVMVVLGQ